MQGPMQSWPLTIDRILDHAAATYPDAEIVTAVAAVGAPRRCSYASFAARVRALASALARNGVRSGDVIDLIGVNSTRQLEAWYAVTALGAVCHPLSPSLPPGRMAALMRDGGARVALMDPDLIAKLEPVLLKLPKLERVVALAEPGEPLETRMQGVVSLEAFLGEGRSELPRGGPDEHASAVLARTVGGSAPPKGVVWTHRTCVLQAMAIQAAPALALAPDDVVLLLSPFWRAAGWGMLFAAPLAGARLALPGARTDAQSLRILADREAATVIVASPPDLQALLEQLRSEGRRPNGLKRIIAVGAPCPPALVRAWRDSFGIEVRTAWGAVEIGGIAAAAPGVVGLRPCFGAQLEVRGVDGRPAAPDAVGRLWARGPASVEAAVAEDGLVDTGDLASLDGQGRLTWLGRADDELQSRGVSDPAWPLEAAVLEHPSTAKAAAIDPPAGIDAEGPVVLVERRTGAVTGKAEYLRFLGDRLGPRSPAEVLFVDGFPLDAAGRIDKRVLRERLERLTAPTPPLAPQPTPESVSEADDLEPAYAAHEPEPEPVRAEPALVIAEAAAPAAALFQPEPEPALTHAPPKPEPASAPAPVLAHAPDPAAHEIAPPAPEPEPAALEAAPHPYAPEPEPLPPAPEPVPEPELHLVQAPAEAAAVVEEPGLFIRLEPHPAPKRRERQVRTKAETRAGAFLILTVLLALAPILMIAAGVLGVQFDLIDWRIGPDALVFDLPFKLALVGILGGVFAIFAAATSGTRRYWPMAILSLVLPIAVLAGLAWVRSAGESYPPVHDVSTDWADPVAFSPALLRARGPDAFPIETNPVVPPTAVTYMNRFVSEVNAETCPGAQGVDLPLPPVQAYALARAAVLAHGLELLSDNPRAGRLEATGTSPWFGFKEDLAVRVRPSTKGARVDLRSVSRTGLWDFGSNCNRVTRLVQAVEAGVPAYPGGAP
jgi:fatty-acyl-CoA synthase